MDEKKTLFIRNVQAYGPEDLGVVDIQMNDGKITAIGSGLCGQGRQELDGTGLVAIPGVIETHAHMLLPFGGTCTCNDFYDGTRAGAFGGVTTLIDFADQVKGGSIIPAIEARLAQAADKCAVDYSFHCTLTDINERTLKDIPVLIERGFTSFKFYTTYSAGGLHVPYKDMERAFRAIAEHGGIATVHAENEAMIDAATAVLVRAGRTQWRYFPQSKPNASESSAIKELIRLAEETGVRLLIRHVSSAEGAAMIAAAQREGLEVYGETCPHYLYFDESVYVRDDAADFIVHPPIRRAEDREGIWKVLESGTKFTIGTDDCAFYKKQKQISDKFYEVPGGMPGIETRLTVLYELGVCSGRIDMRRLAELTAEIPAKLYGLYPRKGSLQVGSDADIVLLRTGGENVITAGRLHENTDYTPFEGLPVHACVEKTLACGRIIIDGEQDRTSQGAGRLLARKLPVSAIK